MKWWWQQCVVYQPTSCLDSWHSWWVVIRFPIFRWSCSVHWSLRLWYWGENPVATTTTTVGWTVLSPARIIVHEIAIQLLYVHHMYQCIICILFELEVTKEGNGRVRMNICLLSLASTFILLPPLCKGNGVGSTQPKCCWFTTTLWRTLCVSRVPRWNLPSELKIAQHRAMHFLSKNSDWHLTCRHCKLILTTTLLQIDKSGVRSGEHVFFLSSFHDIYLFISRHFSNWSKWVFECQMSPICVSGWQWRYVTLVEPWPVHFSRSLRVMNWIIII